MSITPEQIERLKLPLAPERAKTSQQVRGTYLETFDVINVLNDIFGYGGWSDYGSVTYVPELKAFAANVSVEAGGVTHSDSATVPILGEAAINIETPSKDAYTTAFKRAARKFGPQFGNDLYDKESELHATATPSQPLTNQNMRSTMSRNGSPQSAGSAGSSQAPWPRDVPQDAIPSSPVCAFSGEPFTGFTSSTGKVYDPRTEAAWAAHDTGGATVKKQYREQWKAQQSEPDPL